MDCYGFDRFGDAKSIAITIKGIIFDGDGVLTDNRVLEGFADAKPRWRSHYDGQGISLLRAIGLRICFITNEKGIDAAVIRGLVERWNNLPSSASLKKPDGWPRIELFEGRGGKFKVEAAEEWFRTVGIRWEECAVMGDDLVDVPMMRHAILRAAPSSAEFVVRNEAHFVSKRPGGGGAVRDFANFILAARGIDQTTLPTQ